MAKKVGSFAACIVSEPIGNYQDIWKPIPENSQVFIGEQRIDVRGFEV
jgi:hypothetical protein